MQRTWLRGTALILTLVLACGGDDSSDDDDEGPGGGDEDASLDAARADAGGDAARNDARAPDGSIAPVADSGPDTNVADAGGDAGRDGSAPADAGNDAAVPADAGAGEKFATIFSQILEPSCKGCHDRNNSGLKFTNASSAYTAMINVRAATGGGNNVACKSQTTDRVEPGKPNESLLYLKLLPNPPCGDRMPENAAALSKAQLDRIAAWITAGAPQ